MEWTAPPFHPAAAQTSAQTLLLPSADPESVSGEGQGPRPVETGPTAPESLRWGGETGGDGAAVPSAVGRGRTGRRDGREGTDAEVGARWG